MAHCEIGPMERIDGSGWIRRDVWHGCGYAEPNPHHAAGPEDRSPAHVGVHGGYDPACGYCRLGAPHTEEAHAKSKPQC